LKSYSSTISFKLSVKPNANWNKKSSEPETEFLDFLRENHLTDYTPGLLTQTWIFHLIFLLDLLTLPLKLEPPLLIPTPHSAELEPVCIRQHMKSEIDQINHRREVLLQNFPEDQLEGSFTDPILIEDDNNKEVTSLQRSEEAQRELVLRFATYRGYN
jgi:hypothetical protein